MQLILKLLIGIICGIALGSFMTAGPLIRLIVTFKWIFGEFIQFIVPLLILFFITSGIASLSRHSGRILGITVGLAYGSTLLAGLLAWSVGFLVIPRLALEQPLMAAQAPTVLSYITLHLPPVMTVTTALILAFILGIGIAETHGVTLKSCFDEGKLIIERLIQRILIPFLPLYIGSIFVEVAAQGEVWETIKIFVMVLILAVIVHALWLTVLYSLAGFATGRHPWQLFKNMLPAYFTAIGTQSSAATIPVAVRQTLKNNVSESITNFVIPLCATIHLSGSVITIVTGSLAVSYLFQGHLPDVTLMVPFIVMLSVIMVAAPGVPGGSIMASVGLLGSMLGFDEAAIGFMIALYLAQDSFGTACNVTGDGALALCIDHYAKKKI